MCVLPCKAKQELEQRGNFHCRPACSVPLQETLKWQCAAPHSVTVALALDTCRVSLCQALSVADITD